VEEKKTKAKREDGRVTPEVWGCTRHPWDEGDSAEGSKNCWAGGRGVLFRRQFGTVGL